MHVNARRPSLSDARGFTLVELLVVMLIIGILAMIALPAFAGQRTKAQDRQAQTIVRTAAVALIAHEVDQDTFGATKAELFAIEPALSEPSADFTFIGDEDGFTVTARSASGTDFTLTRDAAGATNRSCTVAEHGLCRSGNSW